MVLEAIGLSMPLPGLCVFSVLHYMSGLTFLLRDTHEHGNILWAGVTFP